MGKCSGSKNKSGSAPTAAAKFYVGQLAYLANSNGRIGAQIRYLYIPVVIASVKNKNGIFFYTIVGNDVMEYIENALFTQSEAEKRVKDSPALHSFPE